MAFPPADNLAADANDALLQFGAWHDFDTPEYNSRLDENCSAPRLVKKFRKKNERKKKERERIDKKNARCICILHCKCLLPGRLLHHSSVFFFCFVLPLIE